MIALLVGVALAADPAPAGPTGDVYVSSVPSGAAVLVDGVDTVTVTPTMVHLPAGDHAIEVRTACAHVIAPASVREKAVTRLDLTLPADAPGTLVIATTPPGAFLSIDGEEVGVAPYTGPAACGAHDVATIMAGYLPHTEHISVMAGEATKLDLVLDKQAYGGLIVVPTPLDGVVSVDGAPQPPGPVTLDHVLASTHDVSVALAGYRPYHAPVVVPANDVIRVDVSLDPTRRHIPIVRLGLATAATGAGIGLSAYGMFTRGQARLAYADYLATESDADADQLYDAEVAPRRTVMLASLGVGVPLLAGGALLFVTAPFGGRATDLQVAVGPSGVQLHGRW